MRNENIVFIGFMGSGKSSLARALSQKTNRVFLDSDSLIEMKFQKSISEIFKIFGEEFFRKEEQKLAYLFSMTNKAIISTGGGFIHVSDFKSLGFCIYLRAEFDFLNKQLSLEEKNKRPLFCNEFKAKKLYNKRIKDYEKKADLIIDIENKNIEELLEEITKRI
ncbi:shikimate kinase [Campylobacter sp. TTU-622]|uniref:shikimate kinase n=1 Tax=unclassified Campylobacter TaxID=2593542 RepID=UPI001908C1D3|nr:MULTISPECIES: shikimate kinase [unclassified Campylobacter]MBK1972327.1 shikimate kinase [Campylobacter sp. TTU_617]MBK1973000.1 shikimate kinase [Campylobacter sp. TTU-622]MBK1992178.1 shikimate kinase [Campylobacter sp. 2018MI34]